MAHSRGRIVHPAGRVSGRVEVPGDKSISHRALMLGALARGVTRIQGLAPGADVEATRRCLISLGVEIEDAGAAGTLSVHGRGLRGLRAPSGQLDAMNSGTTARLLMGMLAAHPFVSSLTGDDSLRRRPMRRVIEPLEAMGCRIETRDGRLPARIHGGPLQGLNWSPTVPSAQVKTAVLLAGLQAEGRTTVREPAPTRDHTERALRLFGVPVDAGPSGISVEGGTLLRAADIRVPGDPSSAAFFLAAASALPGSRLQVDGVSLNPTRLGFLDVLRRFGAEVATTIIDDEAAEPAGAIAVTFGDRRAITVEPHEVPGLIDELPVLGAMAALGGGLTVRGAAELRVKESDRIHALVAGLAAFGAAVEEYPDGFSVSPGPGPGLRGAEVDAAGDHRLAMAFAIAALGADRPSTIHGADAVAISYPAFFDALERLCQ